MVFLKDLSPFTRAVDPREWRFFNDLQHSRGWWALVIGIFEGCVQHPRGRNERDGRTEDGTDGTEATGRDGTVRTHGRYRTGT